MFHYPFFVDQFPPVEPCFAQDPGTTNMQILIEKVKADKKLRIANNMNLTQQEAKTFWPLYEGYQRDLEKINKRLHILITDYANAYKKGSIPEELAKNLINEALKSEGAEVLMRRNYAEQLIKSLPATKVARYLQMKTKIRAAIKFDLAAQILLIH